MVADSPEQRENSVVKFMVEKFPSMLPLPDEAMDPPADGAIVPVPFETAVEVPLLRLLPPGEMPPARVGGMVPFCAFTTLENRRGETKNNDTSKIIFMTRVGSL